MCEFCTEYCKTVVQATSNKTCFKKSHSACDETLPNELAVNCYKCIHAERVEIRKNLTSVDFSYTMLTSFFLIDQKNLTINKTL